MSRLTGNEGSFATAVLQGLGAPVTQGNIDFIEKWIAREGGGGANNPLNTTQQMSGSTVLAGNSAGVQNYDSLDTGVQATVQTLLNGYYPNIVNALRAGNVEQADAAGQLSHDLSTWSGGGYTTLVGVQAKPSNSIGGGGVSTGSGRAAPLSGQALVDYAEQNFPQYAYLLHDPEVGPILTKAAQQGVTDPNILAGMLRNTHWWQTTSSTARDFNELKADDPATWEQAVQNTITTINAEAAQKGVGIPQDKVREMAINYRSLGWTQDQLDQAIASYAKYSGPNTVYKGDAGAFVQQLKAMYSDYALPLTDATANQQLQDLLSGKVRSVQDYAQGLAAKAKSLYGNNPDIAAALDNGSTVRQAMSTYADLASQLTGTDPNSINWLDPKWNVALTGMKDPTTGQTTGMSLSQWGQTLRKNPVYGYDTSQDAINTASQFAQQLAQKMTGAAV